MSDLNKIPNRLMGEDSPYLLQHAYNPVDWYPWGEEAFEKAVSENKPIFLSIGYSACHWCHVMEREVFENESLAKTLNEYFVSIKVDKEERPDIDKHFQHIHYIITRRSGGWPTSIFLTPNKKPFFAATYIPPIAKHGMMGFGDTIRMLFEKLRDEPQEVYKIAGDIQRTAVASEQRISTTLDFKLLPILKDAAQKSFDKDDGGILGEPKFPHAALLCLMLESEDKELVDEALHTLRCMAKGGMYDIVDGGFCRYSVDSFWLVPHFEKMTYDNGLLIEVYAKAYGVSGDMFFLRIAKECAEFMYEKMSEKNLFYSASDADSEGEEGKYFVYGWNEALEALQNAKIHKAESTLRTLGFGKLGNFEGKNIARNERFEETTDIQKAIKALKELREKRVYPFIDTKIICSWNSMVISGLFELSKFDAYYLQKAKNSLEALVSKLKKNGVLQHCAVVSGEPKIDAFLEDYAFLARAQLSAFFADGDTKHEVDAKNTLQAALDRFYKNGGWMLSVGEFETKAEASDSSYSSPIGVICEVLAHFGDEFEKQIHATLSYYASEIKAYPLYYASLSKVYLSLK